LLTNTENFDELYSQLKRLARIHLSRERQGHTLQPTALVHEALLRIKSGDQDPQAFFRIASSMMRRILIDHARSRKSRLIALDPPAEFHPTLQALSPEQILAVDIALTELSTVDERQASILEMRFFGGLTMDEIATALDLSSRTVKREWSCARAWLLTRL
jgi:RNA polymerase sigma-70 factor, ECF subfamily